MAGRGESRPRVAARAWSAAPAHASPALAAGGPPARPARWADARRHLPVAAGPAPAGRAGRQGVQRRLGRLLGAVTNPEAVAALELTLAVSAIVAVVNSVAGLAIAFVLVRDDFRGQGAASSAVIDLPFALPTIVAGLTLLALYGADSPFHVDLAGTRLGVGAALLFVTLPFCVRSVQPVLAELDAETEEAAASLGATPRQVLAPGHPARASCPRSSPARASPSPGRWASTGRSC